MGRRVKEFVEVAEHVSLDDLISRLVELRARLPQDSEPELRLRGDDVFGRKISISYLRELTDEEAAMERRYAEATREVRQRELERLQQELGVTCCSPSARRVTLRMAA